MKQVKLLVTGMTCGGCVKHVEGAIKRVVDAQQVEVDLASGAVTITAEFPQGVAPVLAALESEGYPATVTSQPEMASKKAAGSCKSGGSCCCH